MTSNLSLPEIEINQGTISDEPNLTAWIELLVWEGVELDAGQALG
jgi:hypothetical protein